MVVFAQILNLRLLFLLLLFNRGLISRLHLLHRGRLIESNHELADPLWLECHRGVADVLGLLDQGRLVDQLVAHAYPLDALFEVIVELLLGVEVGDGSLLDLDGQILLRAGVGLLPEVLCKLHQIDILDLILIAEVEPVGQVLHPDQDLVLVNWVHFVG